MSVKKKEVPEKRSVPPERGERMPTKKPARERKEDLMARCGAKRSEKGNAMLEERLARRGGGQVFHVERRRWRRGGGEKKHDLLPSQHGKKKKKKQDPENGWRYSYNFKQTCNWL